MGGSTKKENVLNKEEVKYWDAVSLEREDADNWWKRQEVVKRLLCLNLIGSNILEIGVGNANAFGSIKFAVGSKFAYMGTDLSSNWCENAKKTYSLKVYNTDIKDLPAESGVVDFVVALDSLEHVAPGDRYQGYKEIKRVLKAGGKIVLNIPVEETKHNLDFDHGYNRKDWEELLDTVGAKELLFETYCVDMPGGVRRYIWAIAEKHKDNPTVTILTPWENAWVPLYRKVFEEAGYQVYKSNTCWGKSDVFLHMWAGKTSPRHGAINIAFLRRYEFFEFDWVRYDWSQFDAIVFCNSFFKKHFDTYIKTVPSYLVYNAVDPEKWTTTSKMKTYRIGMACHVHPKKNLPLAAQILAALGDNYELHIAGEIQDPFTGMYLDTRGLKIKLYGHVKDMNTWWDDKNYCLSTSISEGNPNNVLEAMAKNIRPVVHRWPGAEDQFKKEWLFDTVDEAVAQIKDEYGNGGYREYVLENHNLDNFREVVKIVNEQRR